MTEVDTVAPATEARCGVTRRLLYAAPMVVFVGAAALFASRLGINPDRIPSALIGKPVPTFSLPPVPGRKLGLSLRVLTPDVAQLVERENFRCCLFPEDKFWGSEEHRYFSEKSHCVRLFSPNSFASMVE